MLLLPFPEDIVNNPAVRLVHLAEVKSDVDVGNRVPSVAQPCGYCLLGDVELSRYRGPGVPAPVVTGNQEYIKIGNEATSKIATIVHQKR